MTLFPSSLLFDWGLIIVYSSTVSVSRVVSSFWYGDLIIYYLVSVSFVNILYALFSTFYDVYYLNAFLFLKTIFSVSITLHNTLSNCLLFLCVKLTIESHFLWVCFLISFFFSQIYFLFLFLFIILKPVQFLIKSGIAHQCCYLNLLFNPVSVFYEIGLWSHPVQEK